MAGAVTLSREARLAMIVIISIITNMFSYVDVLYYDMLCYVNVFVFEARVAVLRQWLSERGCSLAPWLELAESEGRGMFLRVKAPYYSYYYVLVIIIVIVIIFIVIIISSSSSRSSSSSNSSCSSSNSSIRRPRWSRRSRRRRRTRKASRRSSTARRRRIRRAT